MLADHRPESPRIKNFIHRLTDWFTLDNYERDKIKASARIIRRQSRGNVNVQNGWCMTKQELDCKSQQADKAMMSLRQAFHIDDKKGAAEATK